MYNLRVTGIAQADLWAIVAQQWSDNQFMAGQHSSYIWPVVGQLVTDNLPNIKSHHWPRNRSTIDQYILNDSRSIDGVGNWWETSSRNSTVAFMYMIFSFFWCRHTAFMLLSALQLLMRFCLVLMLPVCEFCARYWVWWTWLAVHSPQSRKLKSLQEGWWR